MKVAEYWKLVEAKAVGGITISLIVDDPAPPVIGGHAFVDKLTKCVSAFFISVRRLGAPTFSPRCCRPW